MATYDVIGGNSDIYTFFMAGLYVLVVQYVLLGVGGTRKRRTATILVLQLTISRGQ